MRIVASPALVASVTMYRMFWTPLMDCSSGISTESTSTLALAPGYAMATSTVGGATLGNCSTGKVLMPSTPRSRRMIEMTIASAGRCRIFVNMCWNGLVGSVLPASAETRLFGRELLVLEYLFRLL